MRREDLSGDAREMYEAWLGLGLSEDQALAEVADMAGAPPADPFDGLTEMFRAAGLTEAESRLAAIGRDGSEFRARRLLSEAVQPAARAPGAGAVVPSRDEQRRALEEAERAAQAFHGFDGERAAQWVRRKYVEEWAHLPVAEAVRELKAYARMLLKGRPGSPGLAEGRAGARGVELNEQEGRRR